MVGEPNPKKRNPTSRLKGVVYFLAPLTAVLLYFGITSDKLGHWLKDAARPFFHRSSIHAPAAHYCIELQVQKTGIDYGYYETKPGTLDVSDGNEEWVTSEPNPNDTSHLQDWWTPDFRFWEKFNVVDNYVPPGSATAYAKYQYVLVLPAYGSDWMLLSDFLTEYPQYKAIQAEKQKFFIADGMPNLDKPLCINPPKDH